jgi:anhydro-N-acetylmuramic acid kinase
MAAGGLQSAVGLMSGTSMDGIDAALIDTDGDGQVLACGFVSLPYDDAFRAKLRAAMEVALRLPAPAPQHPELAPVIRELTLRHAQAVRQLLSETGTTASVIGFHGQTLAHRPDQRWTWQAGDPALLAQLTGLDVVFDFRVADVAAGGQGAPFVPLYHEALARAAALEGPLAVVNIGGVGNVTWIGPDAHDLLAFDTGPGNALIDDWMLAHTGRAVDEGGATAARGRVREDVLTAMLDLPWFDLPAPKSLDRADFTGQAARGLSVEDGAATLTAFTAATIALAQAQMPAPPARWLITGGGRHNATLMQMLRDRLGAPVDPVEAVGWRGDAMEAEAFAYLAVRSRLGLPLSLPGTTGVPRPMPGGTLHKAA